MNDRIQIAALADMQLVSAYHAGDPVQSPRARFDAECRTPLLEHAAEYMRIMAHVHKRNESRLAHTPGLGALVRRSRDILLEEALGMTESKWVDSALNLVTTLGRNDVLNKYLTGSGYTAAWFCGLISGVGFSAIAAGDTAASHAGWTEAGATNAPNYSGSVRPTMTFGTAAAAGSITTSAAASFTFSGSGTVKGMFGTSVATKEATTGLLYNAVLFTGGDRTVANGDIVNVNVTYTS